MLKSLAAGIVAGTLLFGVAAASTTPQKGEGADQSYPTSDHECEGADDHAGKPESKPEEAKEKAPQGPEPIYFGF